MSRLADFIRTHDFPCWCGATQGKPFCHQIFGRRPFAVLKCAECGTNRILPRALQSQESEQKLYNEYEHPGVLPDEEKPFVDKMLGRFRKIGRASGRERGWV